MSATLVLETAEFVGASMRVGDDVASPVSVAFGRLTSALDGCGAMAGGDPGGQDWAGTYDRGARAALAAHASAVDAAYRLSSLFAQSARNYEAADAASASAGERAANAAQTALLSGPTELFYNGSPPSASGGSVETPVGWWLVEHTVGYVWPNGHQDRLRAGAAAWDRSAEQLSIAASFAELPALDFADRGLPEAPDMATVCRAMSGHLRELAGVQQSLAASCRDLAGHLDQVHHEVEGELRSLIEQTAVIEGGGLLLGLITAGAAEVAAQEAEASRIARAVAFVGARIQAFITAVRALAQAASAAVDRAVEVAGRLRQIAEMKLVVAAVEVSRRYPAVGSAIEQMAAVRLGLGFRGGLLLRLENSKEFDPELLRGMTMARVRASIPKDWERLPASRGDGIKFLDPHDRSRQIRIMFGYGKTERSVPGTKGPYAVVSQNGKRSMHIPLAGNPEAR